MNSVKRIGICSMRQQQAFEFFDRVCSSIAPVTPEFTIYYDQLRKANKEFGDRISYYRISLLTEKIRYYDKKRSADWRAIRLLVNSLLYSTPEGYREVVKEIDLILKTYRNPSDVPNTEQSGVIKNLIDDLLTRINEDNRKDLGLNNLIKELQESNNLYINYLLQRQQEKINHIPGIAVIKRKEVEKAYRNMIKALEVYAYQDGGNSDLKAFIMNLNKLIEEEKALLKAHRTRQQNKNESDQETGPQPE